MLPSQSVASFQATPPMQGLGQGMNTGAAAEWIFIDLLEHLAAIFENARLENTSDVEASCVRLRETLINAVTVCASNMERALTRVDAETIHDFKYSASALVDEVLVNLDWQGRDRWIDFLLEDYFFGTTAAGDQVFVNVNRLLNAPQQPATMSCFFYLGLLGLGFEGRYRGFDDGGALSNYKKELFQAIYQRSPSVAAVGRTINDQPYLHTARRIVQPRESSSNWPFWLIGLVSIAAVVLGGVAWSYTSNAVYLSIVELLNYEVLF